MLDIPIFIKVHGNFFDKIVNNAAGSPKELSDFQDCFRLNSNILLQAVHIAAQYGQTAFLNFIVAKFHAEFDVPDNDGRSPLHWYVS